MKNLRKLVIASFMLVIAFVAVVSSTYAWFTNGQTAVVNNISIGVVEANKSLLVSKDNTNWSKVITLNYNNGQYTPTTLRTSNNVIGSFQELMWDDALQPYYFEANALEDGEQNGTAAAPVKGYVQFDLYFQVSVNDINEWGNNTSINLDLVNLNAYTNPQGTYGQEGYTETTNNSALSSFRIGFANVVEGENSDTVTMMSIIENVETGDGRYGEGSQFDLESAWMAKCAENVSTISDTLNPSANGATYAHNAFVQKNGTGEDHSTGADAYELTDAYKDGASDTVANSGLVKEWNDAEGGSGASAVVANYEYRIMTAAADAANNTNHCFYVSDDGLTRTYRVRVFVWMEGWDGDCINAASGCMFRFGLKIAVL